MSVSEVAPHDPAGSPFSRVAARRPARATTKSLLIAISHHIEAQALALPPEAVILTGIQHREHLAAEVKTQYGRLAERLAFVALLGAGLPDEPAPGVTGADLADGDPLRREWDMAVVAPHFAVALCALDLGDDGPENDRRFEYVLTHDRQLATEVAGDLMSRIKSRP